MVNEKNNTLAKVKTTIIPHLIAVAIFLVITCMYFYPQFSGKQIAQSDILQFQGMSQEAKQYYEETGIQTLWTNSMFSGMPTYQITAWSDANKIGWVENVLNLFMARPVGYFIFAQISFYLMLVFLGINRWIAIPAAIAFGFTTNNIMLFEAGHTSKLRTLFSSPLVIAGVILAYRNKYLVGGVLFCAALAMNIFTNHPQITYYLGICLGILVIFELVRAIRNKTIPAFAKASGVLVAGVVLALLAASYTLYATVEYSQDTMRGKATLTEETDAPSNTSKTGGLLWDYAMQWSNGVEDVLATMIPRAAGGSSSEPTPDDSEWNNGLRQLGARAQEAPLYYGPLPFTSGPSYFGAIAFFLFILGAFIVRGHLKWWLVGIVAFTALLSMGKHFEVLNHLMFDVFPLYNKFRAPSSVLTITAMFVPILGAFGLAELFKSERHVKSIRDGLIWSYGCVAAVTLFCALAGTSLFDFTHESDARLGNDMLVNALIEERKALFMGDSWRSFLFVTLAAGALWAFHKGWIAKTWVVISIVGPLMLFDLWGVDRRYIAPEDFLPERQINANFTPDGMDLQIMQDKDLHYRVHDLTVSSFQNSHRAYFHHMIGGYHAAKLQRYQDIIERYLSKNHEPTLNMLNARYFIINDESGQPLVRRNTRALGNGWFVEGIRIVNTPEEEIAALEYLDPSADAIVHKDFEHLVKGFDPVMGGTITLTGYSPDKLTYQVEALGDQLAVFSEVWYGPDKGWHAYIDGQPAELLRANYILRALNVPSGKHEIVMIFKPDTYYTLKTVSLIVSLLIIFALLYITYEVIRKATPEKTSLQPEHTGVHAKGSAKARVERKKKK